MIKSKEVKAAEAKAAIKKHREVMWDVFMKEKFEGRPSGNAVFARECRETPLEAKAILDLVWENVDYFGDHYYHCLTRPITMRVEEYYESLDDVSSDALDESASS